MIEIESASHGRPGLASLEPSDQELVARLFGRLSPESVYRRFFSPLSPARQFTPPGAGPHPPDRPSLPGTPGGAGPRVGPYARRGGSREGAPALRGARER